MHLAKDEERERKSTRHRVVLGHSLSAPWVKAEQRTGNGLVIKNVRLSGTQVPLVN